MTGSIFFRESARALNWGRKTRAARSPRLMMLSVEVKLVEL